MTKTAVSSIIDHLLKQPKIAQAAAAPAQATAVAVGMYHRDGEFFKVKLSGAKRPYALKVVAHPTATFNADGSPHFNVEFIYDRGYLARLTDADKMTFDQARQFGMMFHSCVNCGAALGGEHGTEIRSVVAGYGETCAKNNGWVYPTRKEAQAIIDATKAAPEPSPTALVETEPTTVESFVPLYTQPDAVNATAAPLPTVAPVAADSDDDEWLTLDDGNDLIDYITAPAAVAAPAPLLSLDDLITQVGKVALAMFECDPAHWGRMLSTDLVNAIHRVHDAEQ